MKPNITEKEALNIARKYIEENIKSIELDKNLISVKYYKGFFRMEEPVWVIEVKVDLGNFEGTNIIPLVISDKNKKFEFLLDHNGIPQIDCY